MIRAGIIGETQDIDSIIRNISSMKDYFFSGICCPLHSNIIPRVFFQKAEDLITTSDAIIITGHSGRYETVIESSLKKSRHILIFPDSSLTRDQLERFEKLAEEAGVHLFLYHKNLNYQVTGIIKQHFGKPEYIESSRYLKQNGSNTEGLSKEIFYEDLFMIMRINPVNPRRFFVTSIPYFSPDPHLINVRIEFENGTSANITFNNILPEGRNRMEVFRHHKMALIFDDKKEIRIFQSDSEYTEVIPFPNSCRVNPFEEGLMMFKNYLVSGKSNSFENGITAHKFITKIINRLRLVPENTTEKTREMQRVG